ncbi:MAG: Rrf2 family transcriptional regulator [Bacteroidetes bacterium]|nr:Rrf2 family transcriptional regulator [Bacteroidota bacterium]
MKQKNLRPFGQQREYTTFDTEPMFSKATEYAIRAVIFIAQKSNSETKVSLQEIAAAIDSPEFFTAKILQKLSGKNVLITSSRGRTGGFFMTDAAKKRPVMSVLEVMGEDELFNKCVLGLDKCSELKPCPMHHQYKTVKKNLIALFERKTIAQLAAEVNAGNSFISSES